LEPQRLRPDAFAHLVRKVPCRLSAYSARVAREASGVGDDWAAAIESVAPDVRTNTRLTIHSSVNSPTGCLEVLEVVQRHFAGHLQPVLSIIV